MPPRYAYWTILIDQKPTAFRAREREELLPTFHQLRRKNTDVVMKWFARGRLWESPEEAQAAQRAPKAPLESRGRDWRPGGAHRDPREQFKKRSQPPGTRPDPRRASERPGARRGSSRPWSKPVATAQRRDRVTGKPSWRDETRKPLSAGRKPFPTRGEDERNPGRRDRPVERREAEPPTKTEPETPSSPPPPEQIVTKPEPPERG